MLGRAKMIGGFTNGDYSAATGETYYGGSPAKITTDGYLHLCTSDPTTAATECIGVFANSNLVDWKKESTSGVMKATVYAFGPFACRLESGTRDGYADASPYESGDGWDEGSPLYVSATGTWTLTDPGSGTQRGVVMAVGSSYLDVWFY